jgi:RNA polymerase sigma-70 factor (ECF subfamily)
VYRAQSRRVLATLIRLLRGFDAAEEALHEAFVAAAEQWPRDGVPANPYAWLVSAGRYKLIDRWRREARVDGVLPELALLADDEAWEPAPPGHIPDDELRLIFSCCHPDLAPDMRAALTLREVAGLSTEEIARAYLVSVPTIAQRIVRAKAKFRDKAIPYEVPDRADMPQRLDSVLQVIYLIFNEGYAATQGPSLLRADLCAEAIRLARGVVELMDEPEALGLLALMLLHEARRAARADPAGELVLLADQDRALWDRARVAEAQGLIQRALAFRRVGPYLLQAAIADLHTESPSLADTDWPQIVGLYDSLLRIAPSPVAALNRAVALAMRDGPQAGLAAVEAAMQGGALDDYYLAHAACADLRRQLGQTEAAQRSYQRALDLTRQPAERRLLLQRLSQLSPASSN